jgi:hypothetical protein
MIAFVKEYPTLPRQQLTEDFFTARQAASRSAEADQRRAFDIAIRVMTMISPSTDEHSGAGSLRWAAPALGWRCDQSYDRFLEDTFPERECSDLNDVQASSIVIKSNLTARKLVKIAGLKLVGTNDLRNHLRLDAKTGTLEIYHYTSVLKEHLFETKDNPNKRSVSFLLKIRTN